MGFQKHRYLMIAKEEAGRRRRRSTQKDRRGARGCFLPWQGLQRANEARKAARCLLDLAVRSLVILARAGAKEQNPVGWWIQERIGLFKERN